MSLAARPVVIAGNWKMNKTNREALSFLAKLTPQIGNTSCQVLLAVPFTLLQTVKNNALGVMTGAQNMHDAAEGAYTGEISAGMLKDAGALFVLLGHSERRHLFHESSAWINKKVFSALAEGLMPIVCIGETLQEREQGKTKEILEAQLRESLDRLSKEQIENSMIAYEPVWAIGTGVTATPQQAQEMHAFCRKWLAEKWGQSTADLVPLLYGGSVKPDNIRSLLEQSDIDGVLVGGASLSPDIFAQLINYQTLKV